MPAEQLICGARAIADAVGLTRRKIYYLCEINELPCFRLGKQLCASPSALRAWLDGKTAEANRRAAA